MSELRCGVLVTWAAAFFAGRVSIDEVVDAVTGQDSTHQIEFHPAAGGLVAPFSDARADRVPLRDLLVAWRRTRSPIRLVLPVPGDVRGVPGPPPFREAALAAGQAVVGADLAVVPEPVDFAPSSAPPSICWHAYATEPAPSDYFPVADAQYELDAAMRESASALAAADVAGGGESLGDSLRSARSAGEQLNLPPGFPARALALVAQAERLQAVLDLAVAHSPGGAIDRLGMAARDSALRPLVTATRRARLAAYNVEATAR